MDSEVPRAIHIMALLFWSLIGKCHGFVYLFWDDFYVWFWIMGHKGIPIRAVDLLIIDKPTNGFEGFRCRGLLMGLSVARLFVDSVVMGCSAFWYGDSGEIGPTHYKREEESSQ